MCDRSRCMKCGRRLTSDEIGLHKKLVNRASETFMCIDCLGEYFQIPTAGLYAMIERFKEQGCTLFN